MNNQAWALFLDQFDKVRLKSEPYSEMFGARFNRDGEFRLEVRSLKHIVDEIDASFHHNKIAMETSEIIRHAWLEYDNQWRDLVEYANAHISEGFDEETWGYWTEGAPNIRKNGHLYSGLEDYSSGEHFDPKVHNGGQLIEFARNEFRKFADLR